MEPNLGTWWRESGTADAIRFFGAFAALIAAVGTMLWLFIWLLVVVDCRAYSQTTGRETKVVFGSCYIKGPNGQWYNQDEWKYLNATKGI